MNKQLKVFEINWKSQGEKSWVCAHTNMEALKVYVDYHGMDISDWEDDEINEVPKEKWGEYNIHYNEGESWKMTFAEYMESAKWPEIMSETADYHPNIDEN